MKIHRIRLSDFRGVEYRDVEMSPEGVTVIAGPNEIGKSSMAEAIDLLFEEMDSTSKRRVLATKPVGRDVGPRVEADIECGTYRFTYAKRFLRERSTELEIVAPRHESIAGREAHERVQAILAESVDMALWKALRIQQGVGIEQADLLNQLWLSAALDRAAGEAPAGEEEKSLFAIVHAEYLEYWTETGRRKQEVIQLERAIEEIDARIAEIEDSLRSIDSDIEASIRFRSELAALEERRSEASGRLAEHEARVELLSSLEAEASKARLELERTASAADSARRAMTTRTELLGALDSSRRDLADLTRQQESSLQIRDAVDQRVAQQVAARAQAKHAWEESSRAVEDIQSALRLHQDQLDMATIESRLVRLEAAGERVREVADLAVLKVDAAAVENLRSIQRELDIAQARADAENVSISVNALVDLELKIDGDARKIGRAETIHIAAQDATSVLVPDVIALTVGFVSRGSAARGHVVAARSRLDDALAGLGISDVASGEAALASKVEAERIIAESKQTIEEALDGETYDGLRGRLADLRERVLKGAGAASTAAIDREALRGELDHANRQLIEAQVGLHRADAALESARAEQADLVSRMQAGDVAFGVATKDCERLEVQLSNARSASSEDELKTRLREAEAAEAEARNVANAAADRLKVEGVDEARALLINAKDAYARIDGEIRQTREALIEIEARLRDRGEDGLAEERDEVVAERERLHARLRDYRRRAEARRLLYETFKEERTASRRGYVAPLRHQIERLGKVVFGPDFGVELDDQTLRVVSRTLAGRTVPYDSLSVGAREQTALISRLACAMIVAPEGGIPIVIDDALGNSDRSRLEGMGAVLGMAGRDCQVIVLTCLPGRYEFVGSAAVVHLQ